MATAKPRRHVYIDHHPTLTAYQVLLLVECLCKGLKTPQLENGAFLKCTSL